MVQSKSNQSASFQKLKSIGLAGLLLTTSGCATLFDSGINDTTIDPPYTVSDATRVVHDQLQIVDLHADPLLWSRDLLERHSYGHVDLPRLQEGKTALQVFGVVTGAPFPIGLENNRDQLGPHYPADSIPVAAGRSPGKPSAARVVSGRQIAAQHRRQPPTTDADPHAARS